MPITLTANDAATLTADISLINKAVAGSYTIQLGSDVLLGADLAAVNLNTGVTLTIDGQGHQIGGEGIFRGLFVYAGTVTIQNMTLSNTVARGGNGADGGGGGAGLGGGLFVGQAGTVVLSNLAFAGDAATGGAGSSVDFASSGYSLGGGGGMGGNASGAGGGGGLGIGADGSVDENTAPGASTILPGAGGGQTLFNPPTAKGPASDGGGLGGQNADFSTGNGGSGGFGGGGGGGGGFLAGVQNNPPGTGPGGNGGFGGGGGAGFNGSAGGFGGGGGALSLGTVAGVSGFGAGTAGIVGGGGLGAGADIFVQAGGKLTIAGGGSLAAGTVAGGGVAGNNHNLAVINPAHGNAYGSGIFAQGNNTLYFAPGSGQVLTIGGVIADQNGSDTAGVYGQFASAGLAMTGPGTLLLQAANAFTGGSTISAGTLELGAVPAVTSPAFGLAGGRLKLDVPGVGGTVNFTSAASAIDQANETVSSAVITKRTRTDIGGNTVTQYRLVLTLADASTEGFTLFSPPPASFVVLNDLGSGSLVLQSGTVSLTSAEVTLNLNQLQADVAGGSVSKILLTDANPYIKVSPAQAAADGAALAAIATPYATGNAVLGFLSAAQAAPAAVFTWNGGSGSAALAGNWTSPASSAAPGAADEALFGPGAGTISALGAVRTLDLTNGAWTFAGTSGTASSAIVGDTANTSAALSVGTASVLGVDELTLATAAGGAGTAAVSGTGASIADAGTLVVGASGTGTLTINHGGMVSAASAEIGLAPGTDGSSATIGGIGSSLRIGGGLTVGDAAGGQLAVTAGGAVSSGALALGRTASGSATVTGGSIGIVGALIVGDAGLGSLSISAAGTVTAGAAAIGNQTGSDGSGVTVAGTGSRWDVGGELDIGNAAAGGLTITGGATVTASQAQIGLAAGGSGNVNIQGAGSELSIANDLTIGATAPGVLTLGNGTTLGVVNNLAVGKFGVINQFGGVIDPNRFPNSGVVGPTGTTIAPLEVENAGTFFAQNGVYAIQSAIIDLGTLTGAGTLQIKDGGDLVINAAADSSQTVQFSTATGTLEVGFVNGVTTAPAIGSFHPATINGFVSGDTLVVDTLAPAMFSTNGTVVSVISNGATLGTLNFNAAPGGTFVNNVPCFAAGTRIETDGGPVPVEDLRQGGTVTTVLGGSGRIVWVGTRTVNCARHPRPEAVWPVRIARNSFGPGMPARALFVSPDHALFVDGVLVPAKLLLNGTTVRQVRRRTVTYHHVELEQHDVVLAEGMPAESYLDTGGREQFSGGTVVALHPDFSARTWEMAGCAPLILSGPRLEAVRATLTKPRRRSRAA